MPVRINGATSGYVELAAPAVAGSVVMTLPATTGTVAVQGEAYGRSDSATVAPFESTTSTSYVNLTTSGPAVTVTTGTKALVSVAAQVANTSGGATASISFAVSGATTVAATETTSFTTGAPGIGTPPPQIRGAFTFILEGLTAGSNVFTTKYKVSAGTGYFADRTISVIDMGS